MARWLTLLLCFGLTLPAFAQGKVKKKAAAKAASSAPAAPMDEADEDTIPRVVPVFDPGSHTRLIRTLGFNRDQSRLITVGEDSSIQIWSTATGERLDILRLPSYGHEQGYNTKPWDVAAISADGNLVAVGGGQKKKLAVEKDTARAKLLLIDVRDRTVRPIIALKGGITALAFAPDNRLAVTTDTATDGGVVIYSPEGLLRDKGVRRRDTLELPLAGVRDNVQWLHFSPDGQRILAATLEDLLTWDLSGPEPKLTAKVLTKGRKNTAVAWTPDSQRLLRCWTGFSSVPNGLEIRQADGELVTQRLFADEPSLSPRSHVRSVAFLDLDTALLLSDDGATAKDNGSTAVRFDLKTNTGQRLRSVNEVANYHVHGALSPDRKLAAITVSMGLDAVVFRVSDGQEVARCGAASPVPTLVGWSQASASPAIAWGEERKFGHFNTSPADLQFAFDLSGMQPLGELNVTQFGVSQMTLGDWKLDQPRPNTIAMSKNGQQTASGQGGNHIQSAAIIPRGNEPPWFAWTAGRSQQSYGTVNLTKSNGDSVGSLSPTAVHARDVVPSPDGRYLLVSTGTHRLCIYAVEGNRYPLLSVARVNGEWVAWSGDGYYTASPGGEKLFGWAESHGPTQLATFHPAEKFAKFFRRPDLLARAIQLGSMEGALKQSETRSPVIDEILPPTCILEKIQQAGNRVQVRAVAASNLEGKPVVSMRLLLDGRPLAGGQGQRTVAVGEKAEATWDVDVPAGSHELKLLARNDDSSAISSPLIVTGPKSANQQPVLHRLCVGVNEYRLPAFNLRSAAKDADDVFAALEQHCVGPQNRFGAAKGIRLTNAQATRDAVLQAIGNIRAAAKPGDLVVFLFAGHGIKQQDEYYLMTHEADPSVSLQGKSLSGEDLRQALADVECPVLLILDACHSARGVKAFRPATDDLTRNLTDDSAGVTVLAAAMAHEVASATEENGYFTAALLKALQLGQGVPFDPHEHLLYTHHIYATVFSEVRKATNGKQNPFLNMPWTVPPLALRDVPQ